MKKIVELVKPKPSAKTVAFFSFGEGLCGGVYYDTQSLENILKPGCLLAFEMNSAPNISDTSPTHALVTFIHSVLCMHSSPLMTFPMRDAL